MKVAIIGLLASLTASACAAHNGSVKPAVGLRHAVGANAKRFAAGLPPLAPARSKLDARGRLQRRQAGPSAGLPPAQPVGTQTPAADLTRKSAFTTTCTAISYTASTDLITASCALNSAEGSSDFVVSTIDLNRCTSTSASGEILFQNGGSGIRPCDCTLDESNVLTCQCQDANNSPMVSSLNLSDGVSNNDGVLQCFGSFGDIRTGSTVTSSAGPGQTQLPARDVQTKTGFGQTCTASLVQERNLLGLCSSGPGQVDTASVIDLNVCLTNLNGVLSGASGGNAISSCSGCTLTGSTFACICRDSIGNPRSASIDLNTVIGNRAGVLNCYGRFGQIVED